MKPKDKPTPTKPELDEEDDFFPTPEQLQGGTRGKYFAFAQAATRSVVLEEDVHEAFPTAKSVNDALRGLLELANRATVNQAGRKTRRAKVKPAPARAKSAAPRRAKQP